MGCCVIVLLCYCVVVLLCCSVVVLCCCVIVLLPCRRPENEFRGPVCHVSACAAALCLVAIFRMHTALKVAPYYPHGVVHVTDASQGVLAVMQLIHPRKKRDFLDEIKEMYEELREEVLQPWHSEGGHLTR